MPTTWSRNNQVTGLLPLDVAPIVTIVANGAFVDAMRIGMLTGLGIVWLSIVITLLTIPSKMRTVLAELDECGATDALIPTATARAG